MKVYGITGGAGSGKSEVLRILQEEYRCLVIATDEVGRILQQKGQICYNMMVEAFGKGILTEDGELDRAAIAARVFSDADMLEKLNAIVHPQVIAECKRQIAEAEESGDYDFAAVESAILFEAHIDDFCDECWYVFTEAQIRRTRMKETRGYSDEKVDQVLANQKPDSFFFEKCRFVIENNTSLDAVRAQLNEKLSK